MQKIAHITCGQGNYLAAQSVANAFQKIGGNNIEVRVGQHTPTVTVKSYWLKEYMDQAQSKFLKANPGSYAARLLKRTEVREINPTAQVRDYGEILSTLG